MSDILLSSKSNDWYWTYDVDTIRLNTDFGSFYWILPEGCSPENIHTDLLIVATEVLLSPWLNGILEDWVPSRKHGQYPGLSFSGGIDSTACVALMPENTVLLHHRRSFDSLLKHEGADHLFQYLKQNWNREVHSIPSNHEKIRTNYERPVGFSTDLAACVHLIIFADHFDLRGIALGMPIDNTYLWHGFRYRNFAETHWWKKWSPLLSSIGLDIILPIAGISEAGAVQIVKNVGLDHVTSSCLRAPHPGCGKCWKCFLKNGMLGHKFDVNSREVQKFISKRPLKTATHALWRVNEINRWDLIPDLSEFKELDYTWWMEYNPDSIYLLPIWIRDDILGQIQTHLKPMKSNSALFGWDLFPNSEQNITNRFIEVKREITQSMMGPSNTISLQTPIMNIVRTNFGINIANSWNKFETEIVGLSVCINDEDDSLEVIELSSMPSSIEEEAAIQSILDRPWKLMLIQNNFDVESNIRLCEWSQRWSAAMVIINDEDRSYTGLLKFQMKEPREPLPLPQSKNSRFPKNLNLESPVGCGNDYTWINERLQNSPRLDQKPEVSIVIPVYNRKQMLGITLAAIANQTYPLDKIEVVVADDGSSDSPHEICEEFSERLNVRYVRQQDQGYRAAAVRNMGIRSASHDLLILLDGDVAPVPGLVHEYVTRLVHSNQILLCGHRRYVDANHLDYHDLIDNIEPLLSCPDIRSNNTIIQNDGKSYEITLDWRIPVYASTRDLLEEKYPFRACCSGNLGFHRDLFVRSGGFDEDFTDWGAEDTEWGFRVWNSGHWIIPLWSAIGIHQEPQGGRNETDREAGSSITKPMLSERVPLNYRKYVNERIWSVPMVSIYMPAFNAEDTIVDAVNSALNQTYTDLEVCIVDDGSTDDTMKILQRNFSKNPRVRWITQPNSGISAASNAAIKMCRGPFIGQLDSDDLLQPDAVEVTLREIQRDDRLGVIYGSYQKMDRNGNYIGDGYNWPEYSREKLLTGMIVHHFRLFRARDYWRTSGFSIDLENAVDYDFFLKMSEVTEFRHIDQWLYMYRIHSNSTSVSNVDKQDKNNLIVLNRALERRGLSEQWRIVAPDPKKPRDVFWTKTKEKLDEIPPKNSEDSTSVLSSIRRTERFLRIGRTKELAHIEKLYKKLAKRTSGLEVGIHATESKVRPWLSVTIGPFNNQESFDEQMKLFSKIFPNEPIVGITSASQPRKSSDKGGVTRIRFGKFTDFQNLLEMKKRINRVRRTWNLYLESITEGINPSMTIVTGRLEPEHAEEQLIIMQRKFPDCLISIDHDAGR